MDKTKRTIYSIVETISYDDLAKEECDSYDVFMVILFILNVVSVVLETVVSLHAPFHPVRFEIPEGIPAVPVHQDFKNRPVFRSREVICEGAQ